MATATELEEYKALRREIDSRAHLIVQIFAISLAILVPFISGITVYELQSQTAINAGPSLLSPYMFLFPLFILIPCLYLLTSLRKDFFRCGTYIEVFLEDGLELKWETALHKFREIQAEESLGPVLGVYWALFAVCAGLFGYWLYFLSLPLWHLFTVLVATLFLLRAHLAYRAVPTKTRKQFYEHWCDIKQKMTKTSTMSNDIQH